mgnify:CR=1 FL=1
MWKDPIVEEVREAGAKLAEECEYNLHAFADMLRLHQKESTWPTVSAAHMKEKMAWKHTTTKTTEN